MVVGRRLVWSSPRWNAGPKQNGDHAYTPRAVPRCLVGLVGCPWLRALLAELSELSSLSWGVVAARKRLAPYLSAFPAAFSFAPLLALSSASSLASLLESSLQGGGDVIILGIIHHQCKRRLLVNSRASSRLCRVRTYERFVVLATSTRFWGRGRCLVVGGGGAHRVWALRSANVGIDRSLGRHRSSLAAVAAALASRLAVMRCWGGRTQ